MKPFLADSLFDSLIDYFVFIPAYNVSKTLENVLDRIPESIWERGRVLVIDDGSVDNTQEVFNRYLSQNSQGLQYLKFEKNLGYGAVVKRGIAEGIASGARHIACLHGDGQYPAEKLPEFFECLEKGNEAKPAPKNPGEKNAHSSFIALVQGSRHLIPGGARQGKMPLYKRLGGTFLTAVENAVFKQKLTDRHSGFMVYSAEYLRTVDLNNLSPSFDIDLELISIADAKGFKLAELPIPTCYAGEKSNLKVIPYGFRVLGQVWRRLKMNSSLYLSHGKKTD